MRTPVIQDREIPRGDYIELPFFVPGDHTARKLIFVIKASTDLTASRLVERKNTVAGGGDTELTATAVRNSTLITVKLLKANTQAFTQDEYYFDVTSEHASTSSDHYTVVHGQLTMDLDVQSPYDGAAVPVVDTSLIRYVYSGQSVKDIIAEFSDEAADKVYGVIIYPGATMGSSFVNRSYINYQWMASSGVNWNFDEADITGMNLSNQDFTNADFTNCDCTSVTWTGAIVDDADFTGATISLSKDDFKNAVGHFNAVTTIWTDGNPIGGI